LGPEHAASPLTHHNYLNGAVFEWRSIWGSNAGMASLSKNKKQKTKKERKKKPVHIY
jgi:hypothetical protein